MNTNVLRIPYRSQSSTQVSFILNQNLFPHFYFFTVPHFVFFFLFTPLVEAIKSSQLPASSENNALEFFFFLDYVFRIHSTHTHTHRHQTWKHVKWEQTCDPTLVLVSSTDSHFPLSLIFALLVLFFAAKRTVFIVKFVPSSSSLLLSNGNVFGRAVNITTWLFTSREPVLSQISRLNSIPTV